MWYEAVSHNPPNNGLPLSGAGVLFLIAILIAIFSGKGKK